MTPAKLRAGCIGGPHMRGEYDSCIYCENARLREELDLASEQCDRIAAMADEYAAEIARCKLAE